MSPIMKNSTETSSTTHTRTQGNNKGQQKSRGGRNQNLLPLAQCGIYGPDLAKEVLVEHRQLESRRLKETQHTEEVFHGIYQTAH